MAGMPRRGRRRRGDVDDWLMTYADMITLLLCFFAVFLSVSVPKAEKFEKAGKEVRQQFGTPDLADNDTRPRDIPKVFSDEEDSEIIRGLPSIVGTYDDNQGDQDYKSHDNGKMNKPGSGKEEKPGDRITTIEMNSAAFFASGSATLSDEGKNILRGDVMKVLTSDKYKDYQVTVEGHTDDNPIATLQFPSNWELSTGRAAAVARFLLEQGIMPQRIRVAGYADTFPKVPNRDANGNPIPANQAQNRRVLIKLEKVDKDQQAAAAQAQQPPQPQNAQPH